MEPDGTVAARRPLRLDLWFGHLDPTRDPAKITTVRLEWSTDDGKTWHEVSVRRTADDAGQAVVPANELPAGASLSLRVRAVDEDRNSIDQTSIGLLPVR